MNKFLSLFNSFTSLFYIFILVSPNFFLGSNWLSIFLLFIIYLFLYSISSLRIFYILTFPFLLFSLIQLFYYTNIHKSLVSSLLIEITLYQSSWNERMSIMIEHILLFVFCSVIIILNWKFTKKIKISKKQSSMLLILVVFFSLLTIFNTKESIGYKRKHNDNKYHLKTIALLNVKEVFPLNFIRNIWTAHLTHKKSSTYFKNTENFSFGYPKLVNDEKDIIILIIGESSRASSFGLNNSNFPTTPRLQKRKNLVSFKNVYSPYSSTSRSVPFSLSKVSLENWKQDMYKEKSIVSAMKELGYSTFCIDNQQINYGLLDYYKKEVDTYVTTEKLMSYDENIIPILDSIIKTNTAPKKFILIHSYGSHYTYSSRYPRSMAKFTPDQPQDMDVKFKEEINNAYLNTIYYVDFFLDEIIKKVEPYKSSVLYYSDHGENLYDDEKNLILHGYTTPNVHTLNIPLIFWYSEAKKTDNPNILECANFNKSKIISTESIFPSILNLTKLDSSFYKTDKTIFRKSIKAIDKVQYFDENNVLKNLN